jgi:glucosyl-dolichyl phosphate glucuronosyltransferase
MTDASIIVPTRNRAAMLRHTVQSLVRQNFDPHRFEILIVDNGSTDATRAVSEGLVARSDGISIRYLHEPEPGLLSGRHRGLREADGDILIFVDDDIEAAPDWLAAIMAGFADPNIHLIGGPSLPAFEKPPPAWIADFATIEGGRIICTYLSLLNLEGPARPIDPLWIWGLNFAIRAETCRQLGGFHPDCIPKHLQHFQGDGETGLARKLKAAGLQAWYLPNARVTHRIPAARLTVGYFEERFYYQAVCDSYARIRQHETTDGIEAPPRPMWEEPIEPSLSLYDRYRRLIQFRTDLAYAEGFRFHLSRTRNDRRLLEWVMRENYFDYHLPDGSNAGVSERNQL